LIKFGYWKKRLLESGILIIQFPTTPFDTDRAIRLPGRVNGAAVGRKKMKVTENNGAGKSWK